MNVENENSPNGGKNKFWWIVNFIKIKRIFSASTWPQRCQILFMPSIVTLFNSAEFVDV